MLRHKNQVGISRQSGERSVTDCENSIYRGLGGEKNHRRLKEQKAEYRWNMKSEASEKRFWKGDGNDCIIDLVIYLRFLFE